MVRGKFSELWADEAGVMPRNPLERAAWDETRSKKWRVYLEGLGEDALGGRFPGEMFGNTGYQTHAHHIVMQEGLGTAGKAAVTESHHILWDYKINPYTARENLVWAPNWGHPDNYAEDVRDALKKAVATGGTYAEIRQRIIKTLAALADDYVIGTWRP
jgi:hypothetical protein